MLVRRIAASALGLGALLALGLPAGTTVAAEPTHKTTIAFSTTTDTKTGFGGDWSLTLHIASDQLAIGHQDGTVDVTVAGLPGTYASNLPIAGNGDVYVSAPDGKPALSAGKHQLTAFFRPAAGSGLTASHTTKAATVSVFPLTAVAEMAVNGDTTLAPSVVLSLAGTWTESTKSSPPGTWTVTVTDPASAVVFSTSVTQPTASTDPMTVPIVAKLKRGTHYDVAAKFTADSAVAPGLTLSQAKTTGFRTPDLQFAEAIAQPVDLSPIASGTALLVLIALIIAVSILGVQLRRRRRLTAALLPAEGASDVDNGAVGSVVSRD